MNLHHFGFYFCGAYKTCGPCRLVARGGGGVEFFEGTWTIGFSVCVWVAGAVPDPSHHSKQSKEELIWYLQHLEAFSEHSFQPTHYSWPACIVGMLMAMNLACVAIKMFI